VQGDFELTPQLPEDKKIRESISKDIEMVELVPYGCTQLRISIFPQAPDK
jgi:hypothetical protein